VLYKGSGLATIEDTSEVRGFKFARAHDFLPKVKLLRLIDVFVKEHVSLRSHLDDDPSNLVVTVVELQCRHSPFEEPVTLLQVVIEWHLALHDLIR